MNYLFLRAKKKSTRSLSILGGHRKQECMHDLWLCVHDLRLCMHSLRLCTRLAMLQSAISILDKDLLRAKSI